MKKVLFILGLMAACLSMTSCVERIDSGNDGIKVNLVGSDRGVDDVVQVSGWVWYNPMLTQIYEYPHFVQQVDFEKFTMNAKDGSEFTLDPTISLKIKDGMSPYVFKRYRRELKDVIYGPLYTDVKDAYRIEINKFTTDQIVSNREAVEKAVENRIRKTFAKEGFEVIQVTSGLKYPETIVDAVNAKNRAIQEAQKSENEVKVVEAEARKKVVAAQADAEAQRLRTQTLTPAILKQMWIQKWDGHLPTYTAGNSQGLILNMDK